MLIRDMLMPRFKAILGEKLGDDEDTYNWTGGELSSPEGRDAVADIWEALCESKILYIELVEIDKDGYEF